jgi:hypothetical protein
MPRTKSSTSPDSAIASSLSEGMRGKIINYIRAGYPGLYLVSHEEQRVAVEMTRIAHELKYNLVFWSVVDGLVDVEKGTNNSANDPLEALIAIRDLKEKTLTEANATRRKAVKTTDTTPPCILFWNTIATAF